MGFWQSKSLLWDSNWFSEQFYGKFKERERERGALKAFSSELFDSIIEESKEDGKCSEKKKLKPLKQKRKKPSWSSKSKRFFEKPCNKSITIIHFST